MPARTFHILCLMGLVLVTADGENALELKDISFTASVDGSAQSYVAGFPQGFDPAQEHDVLIALHGHGSDRWQFAKEPREECRAARDAAIRHGMLFIAPDYRAKTSWMGPNAEADMVQIITEIKQQYRIRRVFLCGGSMGGSSALTFTARHPELISGVAAMNGTANHLEYDQFQDAIQESFGKTKQESPLEYKNRSAEYWPERFTMPVAITAGGKDTLVPPQSVLRLTDILTKMGRPPLLLYREDGGHSTSYDDAKAALEFILKPPSILPPASPTP